MKTFRNFVAPTVLALSLISCEAVQETAAPAPAASPSPTSPYPSFHGSDVQGEKNFAHLINNYTIGKANPTPWAGFWWPYTGNGIAAGNMGASPAGKYDAARGGMTQAQPWEIRFHGAGVPNVQSWWGHCNGWCAAAALFPEPVEPVSVNGVLFGIRDLKALITEAGMSVYSDFFGERMDVDDPSSPKYWDTVPDQYFLVLTNYMGKLKRTVLIDRYTGSQVWNQPLAGYQFYYPSRADYLGASPEAPNIYRIELTSTIWWMNDGVDPDIISPPFDFAEDLQNVINSRTLSMEVWLDGPVVFDANGKITSSGNVIVSREGDNVSGGAWRMGDGMMVDAWPDYMWVPYSIIKTSDPEQDFVNPEVDVDWIRTHLLVRGGADDPSAIPRPIESAPPAPTPTVPSLFPQPTLTVTPMPGTLNPNPSAPSSGGFPNPGPRPSP